MIHVEGIGKRYRLGVARQDTLRDTLAHWAGKVFRKGEGTGGQDSFWALKNVSFDVAEGEVVGIIGKNGAGKSTLLKILSRITPPTEGRIRLKGRVASLLEVGTGFHPELSGRDNIFMNGAILGMTRREIQQKFDEIVAFSEVEKFLDTPVKRYSSGMYVRLAFAVAAHLEPEILVVDEVLAVGDAEFQRKCLGKMGEVAQGGRTVLFVSHNMGMISALCDRVVYLQNGSVREIGAPEATIHSYMGTEFQRVAVRPVVPEQHLRGDGTAHIREVRIHATDGAPRNQFNLFEPFRITYTVQVDQTEKLKDVTFWTLFYGDDGAVIASTFQRDTGTTMTIPPEGGEVTVSVDPNYFLPGIYSVSAGAFTRSNTFVDWADHVIVFEILAARLDGQKHDNRLGRVSFPLNWSMEKAGNAVSGD
ncbi:MAG: ABC transporter ATP-binding protein [Nitrospirota bacterium]|nr:ABC transporter ATP-binding protein [Nitrospirota bacterium]